MTLEEVLKKRGHSEEEINELIAEAREEMLEMIGEGKLSEAYEICSSYFGLEPDYIEDLF
jgi:hypothetical protein